MNLLNIRINHFKCLSKHSVSWDQKTFDLVKRDLVFLLPTCEQFVYYTFLQPKFILIYWDEIKYEGMEVP